MYTRMFDTTSEYLCMYECMYVDAVDNADKEKRFAEIRGKSNKFVQMASIHVCMYVFMHV